MTVHPKIPPNMSFPHVLSGNLVLLTPLKRVQGFEVSGDWIVTKSNKERR